MSKETLIPEADLAKQLGVAREILAEVRATALDAQDWKIEKNAVGLRPSGVEKIRAALGAGTFTLLEEKDAPRSVYVRRMARYNLRVLYAAAEKEGPADEFTVRVRDNRYFTIGQEIQIQRSGETENVWHLYGKQPRTRGNHRILRNQGKR